MKIMSFLMKTVLQDIWKQDDVVIIKITLSHLMTNTHVPIFGNIVWKVKNAFLKDGIVLKKNVKMTKNISIAMSHKNVYLDNGFVMEQFNVPLQPRMKYLKSVRTKRHFRKEPPSNVQRT